jgi:hypothetical protein
MGSDKAKLHAAAELHLQITAPTGAKTKERMPMSETPIDYDDQQAVIVLLAIATNLRAEGKPYRAEACEYAAARLMSIPTLASQISHPSVASKTDAMMQVVRFITDQNRGASA